MALAAPADIPIAPLAKFEENECMSQFDKIAVFAILAILIVGVITASGNFLRGGQDVGRAEFGPNGVYYVQRYISKSGPIGDTIKVFTRDGVLVETIPVKDARLTELQWHPGSLQIFHFKEDGSQHEWARIPLKEEFAL